MSQVKWKLSSQNLDGQRHWCLTISPCYSASKFKETMKTWVSITNPRWTHYHQLNGLVEKYVRWLLSKVKELILIMILYRNSPCGNGLQPLVELLCGRQAQVRSANVTQSQDAGWVSSKQTASWSGEANNQELSASHQQPAHARNLCDLKTLPSMLLYPGTITSTLQDSRFYIVTSNIQIPTDLQCANESLTGEPQTVAKQCLFRLEQTTCAS